MAELNFGLLTPPGSQSIGNAFTQGMDQAQESRARDLQMQQSVRKGQMDELTYRKALDTEARLNKYYSNIAANGGPKTPEEALQAMLGSGVPHIQDMAAKLQIETLKNNQQLALYRAARTGPSTTPTAVAAPMAPEPGSFGADVAARRAADMFAPPPVAGRTNMLPGAAVAPADVNNLGGGSVAEMIAERDRMLEIPGNAAKNRVASLNADILRASKPPVYHNVQGVGLVDPSTARVITPSVEPKDSVIKQYEYALNQGFKGSLLDFKRTLAAAGRPPRAEAPAVKPLTALQAQKAKETQVAQRSVVKSADTAANELETLADALLGNPSKKIQPDPGLGGITGFMGVLPSMPESQARSAQQKLDTFKGKVMAFGRLLAVQQGKLGNMAVSEWKFISDAIEKIDPAANNFNDQLRDVVRQAKDFAAAKRETFDELYDSATPAGAPTKPSASVAPTLTPADRQALDWAAANPNDPRAAQIRQKNGAK